MAQRPRTVKRWEVRTPEPGSVERLVSAGIAPLAARLLAVRGVATPEEARVFFEPGLAAADPFLLKGMATAVERIRGAIQAGERVRIYGDYDVDGVTSVTLLYSFLGRAGAKVDYYIPNRLDEGYGLNREAIEATAREGVKLLISVDCGVSATGEVAVANELGLDVIVTDHHTPPPELPAALAIINPKQSGCPYPFKELAGVGVTFKLVQALAGVDESARGSLPERLPESLQEYLDVVALGTVADVVPLLGENRFFVQRGLARLASAPRAGITALISAGGLGKRKVDAGLVAFGLGPRINAAGRLGDPRLGVELLLAPDVKTAEPYAVRLNEANKARQELEEQTVRDALRLLTEQVDLASERVIVLAGEGWHPGVIGIVASRITEMFYRPSILIALTGEEGHGSCRSVTGFDMYSALTSASETLVRFGGHPMAAGLTVRADQVAALRQRVNEYAAETLSWETLQPILSADAEVGLGEIGEGLVESLASLAPFGAGNPAPLLVTRGVLLRECRTVGGDGSHLKLTVGGETGSGFDGIGFGLGVLAADLLQHFGPVDVAFAPEFNEWNGRRSVQLVLSDVKTQEVPVSAIDALFASAEEEPDPYADILGAEEFYTKAVGVTFEGRQESVAKLVPGEPLRLVRQPDNPHDANAVMVQTKAGVQVGYLKADLAKHLAKAMDQGTAYQVQVASVTGGEDRAYGVNLFLQREPGEEELIEHAGLAQTRSQLAFLGEDELWEAIRSGLLDGKPFRPKQQEAIESLKAGHNTLVVMGTGRGKSAIFQAFGAYQALRRDKITVILYPLRALVNDQLQSVRRRLGPLGLRVFKATGSLGAREREELAMALALGQVDFILATPEFLGANLAKYPELVSRIGLFVVDESHHIGKVNSNRTAYRRLDQLRERLGNPLTLAVTATAGDETAAEIRGMLSIDRMVIDPHIRTNLRISDGRGMNDRDKIKVLRNLLKSGEKSVIYVNSRDGAVDLARNLRRDNLELKDRVGFYHGGLTNAQRVMVEGLFRDGELRVIIATSAFGEGIDVPDIRHVVHYHLTFNETDFNQQSGRAGRDGEPATIHLVYNDQDRELNRLILGGKAPDRETLRHIYLALTEVAPAGEVVLETNQALAELATARAEHEKGPNRRVTDDTVSAALGIFAELNLLERERDGRDRRIRLLSRPEKKLDLTKSIRYNEGIEEKEAFESFQIKAYRAPAEELLALINRPICPTV